MQNRAKIWLVFKQITMHVLRNVIRWETYEQKGTKEGTVITSITVTITIIIIIILMTVVNIKIRFLKSLNYVSPDEQDDTALNQHLPVGRTTSSLTIFVLEREKVIFA